MGYGHIWGGLALFSTAVGTLVLIVVLAGLVFLLARFLLVATTAAKIYVAKNSPAATEHAPAPETPAPVTKPRTPKAPPAV
jgi:hypothetical protein